MAFSFLPAMLHTFHAATSGLLGDRITITSLSGLSWTLEATIGQQRQFIGTTDVVQVVNQDVDFIIRSADLRIAAKAIEPGRGWKIRRRMADETTAVYEVLQDDLDQAVFRYVDPDQVLMRIHAKLVATE
jgi:hypothetical protein